MIVVLAVLALIGVLAVIAVCGLAFALWIGTVLDEAEPDPYRDGLDASARISAMAFEADRLMHQIAQDESSKDG